VGTARATNANGVWRLSDDDMVVTVTPTKNRPRFRRAHVMGVSPLVPGERRREQPVNRHDLDEPIAAFQEETDERVRWSIDSRIMLFDGRARRDAYGR
jgi:hypothetical protein